MGNKICCTQGGGRIRDGDLKYDPLMKKMKKEGLKKSIQMDKNKKISKSLT